MALSSVPIQPPVSPATSLLSRRWSTIPLYAEHIWRTSLLGREDNLRRYLWIGMFYLPAATEKTPSSSWIVGRDWGTRIMTLRQIQPRAMCPEENSLHFEHFLAFRSQWLRSEKLVEWQARMIVSNLADVSRSCSLSCQRNNVLQHHVVKESHLIPSLNDACEPKITPQQEVVRKRFHYLQKYFSELPMIVSSGDNFFSWRSIHCEPISIRDTIKLRTSSTINSSAYKLDQRIANFARSNQLNDSHIANQKRSPVWLLWWWWR